MKHDGEEPRAMTFAPCNNFLNNILEKLEENFFDFCCQNLQTLKPSSACLKCYKKILGASLKFWRNKLACLEFFKSNCGALLPL